MAELGQFLMGKKNQGRPKLLAPIVASSTTPVPATTSKATAAADIITSSPTAQPHQGGAPSPTSFLAHTSPMPQYANRTHHTGPYNMKRIARLVPIARVLDFSFLELSTIEEIKTVEPRSGELYNANSRRSDASGGQSVELFQQMLPGEEDDETEAQAYQRERNKMRGATQKEKHTFIDEEKERAKGKTKTTGDGIKVLKARGETYAFKEGLTKKVEPDKDLRKYTLDENGLLVERNRTLEEIAAEDDEGVLKYVCTSLKLDNNMLSGVTAAPKAVTATSSQQQEHNAPPQQQPSQQPRVGGLFHFLTTLAVRLYAPTVNLVHLDLSFNRIDTLPSFEGLRLHTLQLHTNRISNGKEIDKLRVLEPTLRKLTLNANPFQSKVDKYKFFVLHSLPFIQSLDDVRITTSDMQVLITYDCMYVKKKYRRTETIAKYANTNAAGLAAAPL